ncbi:P-loop containing nucleoside triphosphate hydrolase protein [Desarmillaria tabescens]|uniref:P-loop containing nucleoside triphosphate hydrolase protein n=1 Tax=Armillaria tabescens TaxID=1929756 RepID=A0AA39NP77_ARMTA|nr:P-loop containing nucleoside triphosphate hydrolase protein [Desarmillaria tabescens]KAK0469251.1 P-loop containing nucleoside triphosphate hydrolase protein [Desarmillaria tabescens]
MSVTRGPRQSDFIDTWPTSSSTGVLYNPYAILAISSPPPMSFSSFSDIPPMPGYMCQLPPMSPFLPSDAVFPHTVRTTMNGINIAQKGPAVKEKKPIPDKSKTEVPCDRYLKRFQIWDPEDFEYVPYDLSVNESSPTPKEEDHVNYFYLDMRYKNERSEPEAWVTNFSKPSLAFLRITVGDDFFLKEPEVLVTSLFPKLSLMRKTLATAHSFLLSDKTHTPEECLHIMKSVGLNRIEEEGSTPESDMIQQIKELVEHVEVLMTYLEDQFKPIADRVALATSYGHAEFDLLQYFSEPGQEMVTTDRFDKPIAVIIEKTFYDYETCPEPARFFYVVGHGLSWNGSCYSRYHVRRKVKEYKGTREISSLPWTKLNPDIREQLKARGKLYTAHSGVHYKVYESKRVIVDRMAFDNQMGYTRDPDQPIPELEEERLHLLPSEVYGFNLISKEWTSFLVEELKEVIFDEHAWDHLVLDEDIKTLIKGLVEVTKNKNSSRKMINDVISGKGGGLISVLHGPPGTGKTLTAESVAELLRRPLYMVGSSELSARPSMLEMNLRSTLSLATAWDAVLLIDEADVFLEQRSLHELERNALVSVALRVLEYHRGVLFLTTNRIKTFDEAFLSRFSIAIKYPELDVSGRRAIWKKFFTLADCTVSAEDLEVLAMKPFNGRTIKNMVSICPAPLASVKLIIPGIKVRTAQALALSTDQSFGIEHILVVSRAQEKFLDEFSHLER